MEKKSHLLILLTAFAVNGVLAQSKINNFYTTLKGSDEIGTANTTNPNHENDFKNDVVKNKDYCFANAKKYKNDFDGDNTDSVESMDDNKENRLFDEITMKFNDEDIIAMQESQAGNRSTCFEKIRDNTESSLVRPLLMIEGYEEGPKLLPVKAKISAFIEQKKKEGVLTTASVYINNTNSSNHIEINPEEYYSPASVLKVAVLLQYLKKADDDPTYLQKKIFFKEKHESVYNPTITNKTITTGQSYTIDELLEYLIKYSDNEAYWLLNDQLQHGEFQSLCSELGIPVLVDQIKRDNNEHYFVTSVNSTSRFFRVLFNGTLVNHKLSDYALNLLLKSEFTDGLVRGIDKNVKVAHKFGERYEAGVTQLHEFGIVYLKKEPYIIGVMTKGEDKAQLADVIAGISKITFDELNK